MTAVGLRPAAPPPERREPPRPGLPAVRVLPQATSAPAVLRYWVAAALLLALGLRQTVAVGVTSGLVLALALAPVWAPALARYRGARTVAVCAGLALVWGLWLTEASLAERGASLANLVGTTALLLGVVCTAGVLLWARDVLPVSHMGLWFALGMLASAATGAARLSDNPWKFAFGIPIAIALLSLVHRPRGTVRQVLALVALAGASALQDSRSYFATFMLAALLVAWQLRPTGSRRGSAVGTVLVVSAIGLVVYQVGSSLLVQGYLGREAQERSIAQIETSGSILVGGRPELTATLALMREHPLGFGSGAVPGPADVLTAKEGMASIGYQPNNGYVENYMFGDDFKLHSMVGDSWAYFGFAGLLLMAVVALLLLGNLARQLAARTASGLVVFLTCWTAWNLLFSPLYSAAPTLGLALGLGLLAREPARSRVVGA
ncbi:hypothetical protein [Cellulomonas aerilata]|uniref:Uncharacterized protein n=1 Tax=Cellulomonas aerilata TaxID=515326 RepID=A0A512DDW0_9CELL|nr:hypothetical protein [Cellulomonas aerilata]GEO34645.1 hypothetical protein CAE01nite_23700 [Cellulomonas aerilata]